MKKLLKYSAALAAAGLLASNAGALPLSPLFNLGALIAGNASVTFGDKTFSDFNWNVVFGPGPAANAISVQFGVEADGVTYFANFGGPIIAANGSAFDVNLFYSVQAAAGHTIDAIDQSFNLSAGGGGGIIAIGETVRTGGFGGPAVAQSSVGFNFGLADANDPPGEMIQGDQLVLNPPQNKAYVTKDIFLQSAGVGSLVGATILHQSFHQVPDGGSTMVLLGSGLWALSLLGLRIKKMKV